MKKLKLLRKSKFFLLMVMLGVTLWSTVLVASAGKCSHGSGGSAFIGYRTVCIGSISAGSHPCQVGGETVACHICVNKYRTYTRCSICGADGEPYEFVGPYIHEYNH